MIAKRDAEVVPKTIAGVVLLLVVALGGCGGPPDISGIWEGTIEVPDEGAQVLTLDLEQGEEGRLFGTMRVLAEGAAPEEATSLPLDRGSVNEDGRFQVVVQGTSDFTTVEVDVSGEVSGDSMDAEFSLGGVSLPYRAERISEEEAFRRNAERDREARLAEADEEERERLASRYGELESDVGGLAYEVDQHLVVLKDAEGRGPEEQLLYALGPADPWDCEHTSVSCSLTSFAQRAESDRQDFEDPVGLSDPCDTTTESSYYQDYDLSAESTTGEYRELRDGIEGAAAGVGEDGPALVETAREMAAAREDAEAAGTGTSEPDYTVPEAEDLAARAEDAASGVEDALAVAEERYAALEAEAGQIAGEMVALREREGCGD